MEPMPFVLDISSDEEAGFEEGHRNIDYDWIREFLGMSDGESDDSDEVFVVCEVKPERKTKSSTTPAVKDVDDDDDCVVLDGDPENRVTSVDESGTGSDELLIVGEKGQIACRDYPHPRHLCGNFPFSSTPHERHCDQCHCYVCDSLAPCLKWGTGISSTDHCHATDKAEMWKIQRKNFKLGTTAPLPASTNYGTSLNVGHPQRNQILPLDITQLSPNCMLPNQASRSMAMHMCSSLSPTPPNQGSQPTIMRTCSSLNSSLKNQLSRPNIMTVNGANHGRCQESGYTLPRNRHQSHSVLRQFLGVRNHAIQRGRGRGTSSLGPQFLGSHVMSKEVDSVGSTLTTNHSAHGSSGFSNHVNLPQQYDKYHAATGFSNDRTHYRHSGVLVPKKVLYTHPTTGPASPSYVCENSAASETRAYSQPFASETRAYSQPLSQSNDSQNFYGSRIQGNDNPSSYVASLNSNQHGNVHQIGTQSENARGNIIQCGIRSQDSGNITECGDTSQDSGNITECGVTSQDSGNIAQCGITSHDTGQQKPHEEDPIGTARKADFADFDSSWAENTSQSHESLIECAHLQSSGSINEPPNVKESSTQLTGCANISSIDDIENWLFNRDPVPVLADGALPYELNIPSPDLSPIDTGMFLFDFENSWNGLAHA